MCQSEENYKRAKELDHLVVREPEPKREGAARREFIKKVNCIMKNPDMRDLLKRLAEDRWYLLPQYYWSMCDGMLKLAGVFEAVETDDNPTTPDTGHPC